MMNIRFTSLLVSPAILGAIVLGATSAKAEMTSVDTLTQVSQYNQEGKSAQSAVTSVSQLSDVKPTDWAFQALQSLVERYGCTVGYPDKTYRGNRAMTRYEFAAGLNSCMDRVNDLIAASTADMVKKEDLATLRKLQEQFAAELATLRGRVDSLEAKTALLEKQQFSTTTKLAGEVIFAVTQEFNRGVGSQVAFQDRVRLSLNTSFTGKDLLVTRLAAGNAIQFETPGLTTGLQASQFGAGGNNSVSVDWLAYYSSLSDKLKVYIPAFNGLHYDYAPTMSPALDSGDAGRTTLSVFGQRNPIYSIGGGSGLGLNYDIGGGLQLSGGYMAATPNNPTSGNGLFNGGTSFLAQVSYAPTTSPFQLGFTYVNAIKKNGAIFDGNGTITGAIGTTLANTTSNPVKVDAYGISGSFQFNPGLVANAFGSYIKADNFSGVSTDLYTYGLGLALPDFGKKGNLLGLVVGAQPYQASGTLSTPFHVEGFYKYQVNDRISVTPGVIWVTNPTQTAGEKSAIIGTVRTTFTF
ncbi:MAG: iron uptake porin [Cyanobacteria bacterium]|nr:iron uptake porin [Cyanobacteriota bacterium]